MLQTTYPERGVIEILKKKKAIAQQQTNKGKLSGKLVEQ